MGRAFYWRSTIMTQKWRFSAFCFLVLMFLHHFVEEYTHIFVYIGYFLSLSCLFPVKIHSFFAQFRGLRFVWENHLPSNNAKKILTCCAVAINTESCKFCNTLGTPETNTHGYIKQFQCQYIIIAGQILL